MSSTLSSSAMRRGVGPLGGGTHHHHARRVRQAACAATQASAWRLTAAARRSIIRRHAAVSVTAMASSSAASHGDSPHPRTGQLLTPQLLKALDQQIVPILLLSGFLVASLAPAAGVAAANAGARMQPRSCWWPAKQEQRSTTSGCVRSGVTAVMCAHMSCTRRGTAGFPRWVTIFMFVLAGLQLRQGEALQALKATGAGALSSPSLSQGRHSQAALGGHPSPERLARFRPTVCVPLPARGAPTHRRAGCVAWGVVSILVLSPVVSLALPWLPLPDAVKPMALGTAVFCAMPTTLSSGACVLLA